MENYFWVANNSDFKLDKTEEHIREYFDIPDLTKDKENYAKLSTEPKYRHLTGDTEDCATTDFKNLFTMEDKVAPDPSGEVFDKLAKYLLLMQHKNYTK